MKKLMKLKTTTVKSAGKIAKEIVNISLETSHYNITTPILDIKQCAIIEEMVKAIKKSLNPGQTLLIDIGISNPMIPADWKYHFAIEFNPNDRENARCAYRFKDDSCGYKGKFKNCDKSLSNCQRLKNSLRFGRS